MTTEATDAAVEPDRSDAGRKRVTVAITIVPTVWGAIFLWVFSQYVAGAPTRMPPPRPGGATLPGTGAGPAGPNVPFIPAGPGSEQPGHEGHDHGTGGHSHEPGGSGEKGQ